MRFMVIVRNTPADENTMPPPELFEAMGKFNQELVDAGVLLAGEGLTPSKDGAIVTSQAGKFTVKDGPFTEAKELVAGFWILQVKSLEEAVAWVKKNPVQRRRVHRGSARRGGLGFRGCDDARGARP